MPSDIQLRAYPDLVSVWHGRSLLVSDRHGNILGPGLPGLYEHDTRLLSRHRLLVHELAPRLASLSAVTAHSSLAYYVAPATADGGSRVDALGLAVDEADRELAIRVARFVGRGMHEDVEVTNHGLSHAHVQLGWELAADFADLIEQRGGKRQQEAAVQTHWEAGTAELRFDYQHPQLRRGVLIRFTTEGRQCRPTWDGQRLVCELSLPPRGQARVCLAFAPIIDGAVREPLFGCDSIGQTGHTWTVGATQLETSTPHVKAAWDRAITDLGALALGDGSTATEQAAPAAGVPLYVTLFGRDALTTAGQALLFSPVVAEDALRRLAPYVGSKDDDFFDEQPGRVPQQVRDGPLALLRLVPWLHDYGDYAAPGAFLVLLGAYHVVTGNTAVLRELLDPAERVLDWLNTRADLDGDGFLEYRTRSPKGQRHQGWKDAGNAVVDEHGHQVEPPIAACEVQGYWYAALQLMAEVYLSLGQPARAFQLIGQARDLKQRFNDRFWMADEGFIAFGLGPDKQPIRAIASNAAHCLATGIVDQQHADATVSRLLQADMFSGWGIRTLSAENPAFNPFKYHLGSVWPVENATAAWGMKRYGRGAECNVLAKGIFDAAELFEHHRLPEVFGGLPRDARHPHPGVYPDACAPQAWSASAIAWLVQAMLGLWTYAPLHAVVIEPELPAWLPDLTLRGLRVGDGRVSIQFRREAGGSTDFRVLEREGSIRVLRQPPPDDPRAGPTVRLRELVESLLPGH